MSVVKISKYSTRLANKYTGEITQCSCNIKVPFILGHTENMCIRNRKILTLYKLPRLQELGYVYHSR